MPSRRQGREQALQSLYAVVVGHREPSEAVTEIVGERADSEHRAFVRDLVFGTLERAAGLDAVLAPRLEGWTVERLATIDRLILEMGVYELQAHPEMPAAVVINEAVELAKKFSTEESNRFVNGVLNAVAKEVSRP